MSDGDTEACADCLSATGRYSIRERPVPTSTDDERVGVGESVRLCAQCWGERVAPVRLTHDGRTVTLNAHQVQALGLLAAGRSPREAARATGRAAGEATDLHKFATRAVGAGDGGLERALALTHANQDDDVSAPARTKMPF
jgi:hypothetical protein